MDNGENGNLLRRCGSMSLKFISAPYVKRSLIILTSEVRLSIKPIEFFAICTAMYKGVMLTVQPLSFCLTGSSTFALFSRRSLII